MSKICSLDFLNREEFDLDIISTGGKKLFSKGDKVTPEVLLSLYFKDVLAREPVKTPEEIEAENNQAKLKADEEAKLEQAEEVEEETSEVVAEADELPTEQPKEVEEETAEIAVEEDAQIEESKD
jgi:hypothetical protein